MGIDVKGMAPLLQVFDMRTSVAFYHDLLGFELTATSKSGPDFGWALLKLNGVELMLNTAYDNDQRPPAPEPRRIAAHKDTCLYFGCPDVDATYRYLREKGVDVRKPTVARYGMKQLFLRDPDGFGICFQWPVKQAI